MTFANTIETIKKTILGEIPNLRQLQSEEAERKLAETAEERRVAHHDLEEAKRKLADELPGLEAAVEKARDRVSAVKAELTQAERALDSSNLQRTSRSLELKGEIKTHEEQLRRTTAPELIEFVRWTLAEFEVLRRQVSTAIASGPDPRTGDHAVWVKSNSTSIAAKIDALTAARKRAQEMELELEDPGPELQALRDSLSRVGIDIEEIKGRFTTPTPKPYDRYADADRPKHDPPKLLHW